jgi:hypothetical protein
MPFSGKVGDSIFIDDLGGGHRYVILTNPNRNDEVVIANFTTEKFGKDCTTTFRRRDYPRLFSKPTIVNYPGAYPISISRFRSEAAKPDSQYIHCPADIVKRILIGAFQSEHTPTGIKAELKVQYPDIAKKYYKKPPN